MNQLITKSYNILRIPNPILKFVAKPVTFPLQPETFEQIQYVKTCFKKNFQKWKMVGLAAPQVGISKRFFVIARNLKVGKNSVQSAVRQIDVFINPEIVKGSEEVVDSQQNCVSVPSLKSPMIQRHDSIAVKYFSVEGQQVQRIFSGFKSYHLNGITIDQRLQQQK